MKLSEILNKIDYSSTNFRDVEVDGLVHNSKDVEDNFIFFAISGDKFDGLDYVEEAIANGASVVVTDSTNDIICDAVVIKVGDVRYAMSMIAKAFYNNVDEKIKLIGIVGTNGKTTTSTIIFETLKSNGLSVGLIGTNGVKIGDILLPSDMTTPDPIELYYILNQMYSFGVTHVVMEVSAHAIFYQKVVGLNFDVGVFTNITPEHLDFFGDMENYSSVKCSFFSSNYIKECVVNIDDEIGRELAYVVDVPCISYGLTRPANIFAIDINMTIDKMKFVVNAFDDIYKISTCMVGSHNVYNIMAAIGVCKLLGLKSKQINDGINKITGVRGRWEVFTYKKDIKIIVDYAHTPDGFEKILSLVKALRKGRIISLFGCVGYSLKEKRHEMGEIASKYSDYVIITSDNPCDCDFDEIVNDIDIKRDHVVIEDREESVKWAFSILKERDTLVLLGKGGEKHQKIQGKIIPYCELELVDELINN